LAALAGSQLRSNGSGANINNRSGGGQQTHEMTVPNDLIGCIIGKGGTKIAEIRCVFNIVGFHFQFCHFESVINGSSIKLFMFSFIIYLILLLCLLVQIVYI